MAVLPTPILPGWGEMSRVARDAAYDNMAACAGGRAYIDTLRADSHALRASRSEHLDLRYGDTEREAWDLFPATAPGADCLVFIHGGYWQRNDRQAAAAVVEGALAKGWAAALPGYTLAPDATLTTIVAQLRTALDWLAAHGPKHGIGGRILLSGWSAGGHLAVMASGHSSVTATLAISGIFELGPLRDTDLNEKLQLSDDEVETLSPLRLAPDGKPMTLAYGSGELPALIANSRTLYAQRAGQHRPGALLPVAGADHFSVLDALRHQNGVLLREAASLMR